MHTHPFLFLIRKVFLKINLAVIKNCKTWCSGISSLPLRDVVGEKMLLFIILKIYVQTYVFKLMSSSGQTESGESEKVLLLMESGARLHTTDYER